MGESIKRWMARRKAAAVLEVVQGRTTISEVSRQFDLTRSEIGSFQQDLRADGYKVRSSVYVVVWGSRRTVYLCRLWVGRDGWLTLALVMDCTPKQRLGSAVHIWFLPQRKAGESPKNVARKHCCAVLGTTFASCCVACGFFTSKSGVG
jgi:hypothetical protein